MSYRNGSSSISQAVLGFFVGLLVVCVLGLAGIGIYQVVDWCTDNTTIEEEATTDDTTTTDGDATAQAIEDIVYNYVV